MNGVLDEPRFNVNDRVVLLADSPDGNPELFAGDTGTVCSYDHGGGYWVSVRWDKKLTVSHHDCGCTCEDDHGWQVPRGVLELESSVEIHEFSEVDLAELLLE